MKSSLWGFVAVSWESKDLVFHIEGDRLLYRAPDPGPRTDEKGSSIYCLDDLWNLDRLARTTP